MPGSARRSIPARPEVGKSDTVVNFCPALGTRARPVSHPESLFKVNCAQAAICGKTEECDRTLNSHRRDDWRLWPEWRLSSSHRLPMPPVFGKFRPMGCRPGSGFRAIRRRQASDWVPSAPRSPGTHRFGKARTNWCCFRMATAVSIATTALRPRSSADAGFVVVAPQHDADYLIGGRKSAQALGHRYLELATALNAVITDPEFGDHASRETVHGAGYSSGGTTILLAAGAQFALFNPSGSMT